MASSTRHGGDSYTPDEMNDPSPPDPIKIRRAEIGYIDQAEEETPSPEKTDGGDSTRSSKKDPTSSDSPKPHAPKAAPTTGNRSSQTDQDSGARSTGGNTQTGQHRPSRKPSPKATPAQRDEFDEFE